MIAFAYMSGTDHMAGVVPVVLEVDGDSLKIKANGALIDLPLEYVNQAIEEAEERRRKCTT